MKKSIPEILGKTNIVGVVASESDSRIAWGNPFNLDMIEWRVDCCQDNVVEERMKTIPSRVPVIITVRDHREGGKQPSWNAKVRAELYKRYMTLATFIDIEASTAKELMDVIEMAKSVGIGVIISQHVFDSPWHPVLTEQAAQICHDVGGDVFKVALLPDGFYELARFIMCTEQIKMNLFPMSVAPMAMGKKFGKASRLLFAAGGAPLVYGYFDSIQVEGQWSVFELRKLLPKILE